VANSSTSAPWRTATQRSNCTWNHGTTYTSAADREPQQLGLGLFDFLIHRLRRFPAQRARRPRR
jgi:hypothetical protein